MHRMRTIKDNAWLMVLFLGFSAASSLLLQGHAAANAGGITLSPATLTLSLPKGASQQQAQFTVSNKYDVAVNLHFGFGQSVTTPGVTGSAAKQLSIAPDDLLLPAKSSASPTITLSASSALPPGSQEMDLIITQETTASTNVSIVPSIRMPLILVRQDGAITSFSISADSAPHFRLKLPSTLQLTIHNTGNVVAIPHGYISISDQQGRETGKGVINTASAAIAPGGRLYTQAVLTPLHKAWTPGTYKLHISYGAGSNSPASTATLQFFYFPAWELLVLGLLVAGVYCGWRIALELRPNTHIKPREPKP